MYIGFRFGLFDVYKLYNFSAVFVYFYSKFRLLKQHFVSIVCERVATSDP